MWLSTFRNRLQTLERREQMTKFAGLGGLYGLLDNLGWFGRAFLWLQVFLWERGAMRRSMFKSFEMYWKMKSVIKDAPPKLVENDD